MPNHELSSILSSTPCSGGRPLTANQVRIVRDWYRQNFMETQPVKLAESHTNMEQKGFQEDQGDGELSSPQKYMHPMSTEYRITIGVLVLPLSTSQFINRWLECYVSHYGRIRDNRKDREPIARRTVLPEKQRVYDQSEWVMQ